MPGKRIRIKEKEDHKVIFIVVWKIPNMLLKRLRQMDMKKQKYHSTTMMKDPCRG